MSTRTSAIGAGFVRSRCGAVPRSSATGIPPEKGCGAVVETLASPRTVCTTPAKDSSTPSPRCAGSAAAAIASARFAGPSATGESAGCCAPVKTTGRGSVWVRSTRREVSSIVSVPWVTTTPATSGEASASATAARIASNWSSVSADESTAVTSRTVTRTPGTPPAASTRSAPASAGTAAPASS